MRGAPGVKIGGADAPLRAFALARGPMTDPTPPLPDPIPGKPPLEIPPGSPKPEFDDPVIPFEDPAPAPTMPDPGDGRPYDTPPRRT